MSIFGKKNVILEYAVLTVGVTLLALAISLFFSPANLVTGGFSGLAIIVRSLSLSAFNFEIPLWLTNTVLNIPLFVFGLKLFGVKQLAKTIYAAFFLSFALYFTEKITGYLPKQDDLILISVYGGLLSGIALAVIFRCMATTGGTDMLGMIANRMNKSMSIATHMMIFDVIIIAFGMFTFGYEKSLYAIIAVFVTSKVCDSILEGLHFAKAAFIITEKSEEVAKKLMDKLGRGTSIIHAKGGYTLMEKNIVLSVVSRKEIPLVKDAVVDIDRNAFVIVTDVAEVLGEGFIEIRK